VHVVPHPVHKEKIPSLESLLEYCHLTKPAPGASARPEDGCRGFRFHKDVRAHLDSTPQSTCHVTEEPVLRDTKARMFMKSFDEQVSIPKGDSAMWKCGGADLACKLTLDATEFILEILSPSDVFSFYVLA
jgi:hypothetical protein